MSRRWLKTVTDIQQLLVAVDSKAIDILQVNGVLSEISRVEAEISPSHASTKRIRRDNISSSNSFLQFQWAEAEAARIEEGKHPKRPVEGTVHLLCNEVEVCVKNLASMTKKRVLIAFNDKEDLLFFLLQNMKE